jgi:hypothetical protein
MCCASLLGVSPALLLSVTSTSLWPLQCSPLSVLHLVCRTSPSALPDTWVPLVQSSMSISAISLLQDSGRLGLWCNLGVQPTAPGMLPSLRDMQALSGLEPDTVTPVPPGQPLTAAPGFAHADRAAPSLSVCFLVMVGAWCS